MFHVYILYSPSLKKHYIGQSSDIDGRMLHHLAHSTPFTSQADDWRIVFLEAVSSRKEAMALEAHIKRSKSRKSMERYICDSRNIMKSPVPVSDWHGQMGEVLDGLAQPGSVPTS